MGKHSVAQLVYPLQFKCQGQIDLASIDPYPHGWPIAEIIDGGLPGVGLTLDIFQPSAMFQL